MLISSLRCHRVLIQSLLFPLLAIILAIPLHYITYIAETLGNFHSKFCKFLKFHQVRAYRSLSFFITLSDLVTLLSLSDSRLPVSLSLVDRPTKRGIYGGPAVKSCILTVISGTSRSSAPHWTRYAHIGESFVPHHTAHLGVSHHGTHWKVSCATPSYRQLRDRICSPHDLTVINLKGFPLVQHSLHAWVQCLAQNHSALDFKKGHRLD